MDVPRLQGLMGWSRSVGSGQAVTCRSSEIACRQVLTLVVGSAAMTRVKQVRVLRNVMGWGVLCAIVLWLVGDRLQAHWTAIVCGVVAGGLYAVWHWRHLSRRIA